MSKELEAINLALDLMERFIQPTIFKGLKSDLNAIDFKLNKLSKISKLLELKNELISFYQELVISKGRTRTLYKHINTLKDLIKALEEELK